MSSSTLHTPTDSTPADLGSIDVSVRSSSSRGHAHLGWLNSYHTFSFANYYDPRYQQFHALRVINEDRVKPGRGFGEHPHSNFEIFSYVVRGALRHTDSMGNRESLGRGSVQFTSAGSGIEHAEYNDSDKEMVHFLQIWVKPNKSGLKPRYSTKQFSDQDKLNQLRLIVSEKGDKDSIVINQDMNVYASILEPGKRIDYDLRPGREVYFHLIQDAKSFDAESNQTGVTITSQSGTVNFKGGDGAFIKHPTKDGKSSQTFTITGAGTSGAKAEFILFDIKKEH